MGETAGHIKKVLGNVTDDREVEAEGRAEEEQDAKPSPESVDAMEDEVQEARGEKHRGPASS
ncbi:MAG: CsbD family protein [Acidimicrobiales bacterium]